VMLVPCSDTSSDYERTRLVSVASARRESSSKTQPVVCDLSRHTSTRCGHGDFVQSCDSRPETTRSHHTYACIRGRTAPAGRNQCTSSRSLTRTSAVRHSLQARWTTTRAVCMLGCCGPIWMSVVSGCLKSAVIVLITTS